MRAGVLYLVDDHGRKLTMPFEEQMLLGPVTAHLYDMEARKWYVHNFCQATELNEPRILQMLIPLPNHFPNQA